MSQLSLLMHRFAPFRSYSLLLILSIAAISFATTDSYAQSTLRPELGKPLKSAQELVKAGKYREALGRVNEADSIAGKSPAENLVLERMRFAAASGAGDGDSAAKAYQALSNTLSGPERLRMIESIGGSYYRGKDYSKAYQWYQRYFREGGVGGSNRTLMIQSQYLSGDLEGASKGLMSDLAAAEKSNSPPPEDQINLLMSIATARKDVTAETFALERLVTYYPKKEYWGALLGRLQRRPGFSDRLVLDVYRLSLATDSMRGASDFMEMTQLALQAGSIFEAKQVVDKGFAQGILGVGPDAPRHERLRTLVATRLKEQRSNDAQDVAQAVRNKDGNDLVVLGLNQVFSGRKDGLVLIQQGIDKGGLKRSEDAKLHFGVALMHSGERSRAQSTFRSITGSDGTADLARLWLAVAARKVP